MTCTTYSCQVTSSRRSAALEEPADAERTRLTRAVVVDRALQLADADGLEALTIRKLATDLGVTPMALYWHFRSKDELLDGLTERLWGEMGTPAKSVVFAGEKWAGYGLGRLPASASSTSGSMSWTT